METADEIFPGLQIDAHFTTDGTIHLGKQGGRHLHKFDSAQISCCHESSEVANHAAAERDNE